MPLGGDTRCSIEEVGSRFDVSGDFVLEWVKEGMGLSKETGGISTGR